MSSTSHIRSRTISAALRHNHRHRDDLGQRRLPQPRVPDSVAIAVKVAGTAIAKMFRAGIFKTAVIVCLISLALPGCGLLSGSNGEKSKAGKAKVRETADDSGDSKADDVSESESGESTATKSTSGKKSRSGSGKSIDGIPYDLWFDEPLTVAADRTPVGTAPTTGATSTGATSTSTGTTGTAAKPTTDIAAVSPASNSPDVAASGSSKPGNDPAMTSDAADGTPPTATTSTSTAGGDAWADLISGDALKDEVKRIRNKLNESLTTVGKYNGNREQIRTEAATLAILAVVAENHPEQLVWKKNAGLVREVSQELFTAAKDLAQAGFSASKKRFEQLESLLSGSKPPDVGEPTPAGALAEVASRRFLMKRIDAAHGWLKSNVPTESALKKDADRIAVEASILAILAKVAADPTQTSADEDEYQQFAKGMLQANRDIISSAKSGDFAAFTDAMGRNSKACADCHPVYQLNSN